MCKKMLLVFILFFSPFLHAETYNAWRYFSSNGHNDVTPDLVCPLSNTGHYIYLYNHNGFCNQYYDGALVNQNYSSVVGPSYWCATGQPTGSPNYQCINAPACVSPLVRSSNGVCSTPVGNPICGSGQNPLTTVCNYVVSALKPPSCLDGSTLYGTAVCPTSFFQQFVKPDPGQTITCSDGRQSPAGHSCFYQFWDDVIHNDAHALDTLKFVGFGTGALNSPYTFVEGVFSRVSNGTMTQGLLDVEIPVLALRSLNPIAGALDAPAPISPFVSHFNLEAAVPPSALGSVLTRYFAANPVSEYTTNFKAASALAGQPLTFDDTGTATLTQVATKLSSNQLADFAQTLDIGIQPSVMHPIAIVPVTMPIADFTPYVAAEDVPWIGPAMKPIETDFQRVFAPIALAPVNFNVAVNTPYIAPYQSTATPPLASFTPYSPSSYPQPTPTPSPTVQPSPIVNPNPVGTDAQSNATASAQANATAGTPVIGGGGDVIPPSPTVYPDTYKFFDFLNTANPFMFDVNKFMPNFPNPSCTYEVHTQTTLPFIGAVHLDFAPCAKLLPLRQVLHWVFAVLTTMTCFFITFRAAFNN